MAQTTSGKMTRNLRKMDFKDLGDMDFTFRLRRDNAQYFFSKDEITPEHHLTWMRGRSLDEYFEFFIIEWRGNKAGTIAIEHQYGYELLQNLCIEERYRGKGLAKWAIKQLMRPNRFIIAQVKSSNKHVIKMYQELGFWRVKK